MQPAITRTCREIRKEALPLLYATGTFTIYGQLGKDFPQAPRIPESLFDWFKVIGDNINHLEEITLVLTVSHGGNSEMCLCLKLRIKNGVMDVAATCLMRLDEQSTTKQEFWSNGNMDLIAQMHESDVSKALFSRSNRLKARTPGFAAHEWVSVIERVKRGLVKLDMEKFCDGIHRMGHPGRRPRPYVP
ncbi:uncharacterized protein LTR77_005148 [Saxophila tyrrhenica]|uniref:Uncharacterized protein n=1 Tax=Saxophila tyrrhenica TaxID=1690608 RepID=A0AAV9PBV1_9PEZI|nr:hypothetical protein LTR77_005148 [Saxophila tyrrhenica]